MSNTFIPSLNTVVGFINDYNQLKSYMYGRKQTKTIKTPTFPLKSIPKCLKKKKTFINILSFLSWFLQLESWKGSYCSNIVIFYTSL